MIDTSLMQLRFVMAVAALAATIGLSILLLFYGKELSQTQTAILSMLLGGLLAELKTATSWIFDGVADKVETVQPQPDKQT